MLWAETPTIIEVVVAWDAPTTNTDGTQLTDLSHYNVYWQLTGAPTWETMTVTTTTATIPGSQLGTGTYAFRVRAVDFSGNESEDSNVVYVIFPADVDTMPPAPPGTAACTGTYAITLGTTFTVECVPAIP